MSSPSTPTPFLLEKKPETRNRSRKTKNYPEEEDQSMIHYVAERSKTTDSPLMMANVWKDFVEWSGSNRSTRGLQSRFRRHLSQNIHRMTHYDLETRIRMLYATSTRVDEQFLEEIRETATVIVGPHGTIIEYDDGGLKLSADEPAKKRLKIGEEEEMDSETEDDDNPLTQNLKGDYWNTFVPLEQPSPFFQQEFKPDIHNLLHNQNADELTSTASTSSSGAVKSEEMGEFMSVMKDFVTTQTQWIKLQMEGKSSITPSTSQPAPSFTPNSNQYSSKKGFLHLLRSLVLGMDIPELDVVRQRISRKIDEIGDGDEKITNNTIKTTLENILDNIDR